MKELLDILAVCRNKGIQFTPDASGEQLKMWGNIRLLTAEEVGLIKSQKAAIIDLLNGSRQTSQQITPAPLQPHYALSSSQQRMWILNRLNAGNAAYHITMANVFEGQLNTAHLETALQLLISRHAVLRTVFREDAAGEVRQYITGEEEMDFTVSFTDISDHPQQEIEQLLSAAQRQAFNLETGPLLRAGLYQLSPHQWIFHLVIHHIISDGWSMEVLISELLAGYQALCRGENGVLPPLSIQYHDYAHWQQEQIRQGAFSEHRSYWLQQFEGELPLLQLPADKPRPAIKTGNGGAVRRTIGVDTTRALKTMIRAEECTLFMGLATLVQTLLYLHTFQEEVIIGFPVAGRDNGGLDQQIGLYMNTLALRAGCNGTESYRALLRKMKQVVIDAQAHQAYPFDLLVDELRLQRDMSRNALFDVMINLKDNDLKLLDGKQDTNDLCIAAYEGNNNPFSKLDYTFNFVEGEDRIELEMIFNNDIYLDSTAAALADNLLRIIDTVINDPEMPVVKLDYLGEEETARLLYTFNSHPADFPADETVVSLFREQAACHPEAIALVAGSYRLSYAALDKRTNRLARFLRAQHPVQPDMMIAVMLDRSPEMIIAILAILKSGAAYVPLDPEYPAARIAYILQDSGAGILLTSSRYSSQLADYNGAVVIMDEEPDIVFEGAELPDVEIKQEQLAYMIYTSGTTGHPKGVMITHGCLVDYFYGLVASTNVRECRHFGIVSTIAADLGNTVLYTALLLGGALHIYDMAALMDARQIFDGQLDCIKIVPSHWKSLQSPDRIFLPRKCIIFGGESLTTDVLEMIRDAKPSCEVYNHYGPSEATIGKLICRINLHQLPSPVPLGAPFCQSSFYILNPAHKPVPVGVTGEICIAGAGLARGYYNRPEQTAEKFVSHPFREGALMYKTGDLGRWQQDGTIVFIGRKDEQVKIRGFRVEPAEIAICIRAHHLVDDAVVAVHTNTAGEKELVAYVVGKPGYTVTVLRNWLGQKLPAYMLPAYYMSLDKIPLTPNGKTDKRALPLPSGPAPRLTDVPHIPPRNDMEMQLAAIWQELLGKTKTEIGIKDNFFDAGGHSLKMMQLITRINRSFSVSINIPGIFKEPTIENISEQISFILDQNRQKNNRRNLKQVDI